MVARPTCAGEARPWQIAYSWLEVEVEAGLEGVTTLPAGGVEMVVPVAPMTWIPRPRMGEARPPTRVEAWQAVARQVRSSRAEHVAWDAPGLPAHLAWRVVHPMPSRPRVALVAGARHVAACPRPRLIPCPMLVVEVVASNPVVVAAVARVARPRARAIPRELVEVAREARAGVTPSCPGPARRVRCTL